MISRKLSFVQIKILGVFVLVACQPRITLAGSLDSTCSGTVAVYSPASNALCLPAVEVIDNATKQYYQAQLNVTLGANPLAFSLSTAVPIPAAPVAATFTTNNGRLTIPVVEVRSVYGVDRYNAELALQAGGSNSANFALTSIAAIISADYAPGQTWKPYVGLLPNEKAAVNVLEDSYSFGQLANAVYDFGNAVIGDWMLLESVSRDSGMQAAVYANKASGDYAIAYRGTEFCIIPIVCSFSELKESGRDTLADTLLTQGRDSGQFDDAYNYARDMLAKYTGKKISITGHSLGGGLAQAVGASFTLDTYAFNSSPVANNFFDQHNVKAKSDTYANFIHVLADIHDPVSSTNHLGAVYSDAAHVAPLLQYDFDKKEVLPTYKTTLDSLRFNKHGMEKLLGNIMSVRDIYRNGW